MYKSKLSKVIVALLRRIAGVTRSGANRLMRAMLRSLMAMGRRANLPVAGFVLPTVTMVLLVVILLTIAITLRSFDRANTARNVRVNQQVLAAATPAIDRAKAKIEYMLLKDPQKPTATPSDPELYRMIADSTGAGSGTDTYTFGDETRLKLKANLDSVAAISPDLKVTDASFNLETNESINTAWRYPVDTNNDGKYDTFTLYGIFFRSPPRIPSGANAGEFTRARKPLEARTPPMSLGVLKKGCEAAAGNSASLVGDSGWYSINGRLLKSFFVYTVNVPIKQGDIANVSNPNDYLPFTGTTSISALEYQQDQSRIPLSNNAVVYEDDLEISPGPKVNINGRMITNSNLLVSGIGGDNNLKLYQVSSPDSCFYDQENSKIIVGGNVVNGGSGDSFPSNTVPVHLFQKDQKVPLQNQKISTTLTPKTSGQSVNSGTALDVLYNNQAFQERINLLVKWQKLQPSTNDPLSVQKKPDTQTRDQALENYFKLVTQKVPFADIPFVNTKVLAIAGFGPPPTGPSPILDSGESLRPTDLWNVNKVKLDPNQLEKTPVDPKNPLTEETYLGDRIVAGNSLPSKWWDSSQNKLVSTEQAVAGATSWNSATPATPDKPRTRTSGIQQLADVGATDRGNGLGEGPPDLADPNKDLRDGFWEASAAQIPKTAVDGIGGLRVITSAGVYDRTNSFLPPPKWIDNSTSTPSLKTALADKYDDPATVIKEEYPVVWPDTMPMSPLGFGSQVYNNVGAGAWAPWPGTEADGTDLLPSITTSNVGEPLTTKKYAKGDLRMRATAVYHYADNGYKADDIVVPAQPSQKPIACISSYYDPSSALTALNIDGLANVSGQGILSTALPPGITGLPNTSQPKVIGSNNGITYNFSEIVAAPNRSIVGSNGLLTGNGVLDTQANLVFPDGRFANGPLRSALQVEDTRRTLAQKSAIDSTNCALHILKGANLDTKIPHGAIQEVAFLNAREIKAVDRDDSTTNVNEAFTLSSPLTGTQAAKLTGNYNQPLEERQPLEIRATQIDLDQLRQKTIAQNNTATGPDPEYLLPNSGIIYASRDDALPDRSDRTPATSPGTGVDEATSKKVSPSDSLLDPTRKPNGIVLINGKELFRGTSPDLETKSVTELVKEKGLILVSNLPVYIKGEFNLHTGGTSKEEFDQSLPDVPPPNTWTESDFYGRKDLNSSFACRKGDPRLTTCMGDKWRQATVLADAVTMLSQNYRFGFRNEGDFDLRNNAGSAAVLPRRQQGFFNNNFVTNGLSSGAFSDNGNLLGTPDASTTPLTDSTYVALAPRLSSSYFNNFVTPVQRRGKFPEYVMEVCTKLPVSECKDEDWHVNPAAATSPPSATGKALVGQMITVTNYPAGTTVIRPTPQYQRFPRRVAFNRSNTSPFALTSLNPPVPLGVNSGRTVTSGANAPVDNSLWFAAATTSAPAVVSFDDTNSQYLANNSTAVLPSNTTIADGSATLLPSLAAQSLPNNPLQTSPPTAYSGSQPLLLPVPQLQIVTAVTAAAATGNTMPRGGDNAINTGWIPRAVATTFNLIVGAGDTPSRALISTSGDFNGGLQNLPRFLESWNNGGLATNIKGSFVQLNRSAFSTSPYQPILPISISRPTSPSPTSTPLMSLFETQISGVPSLSQPITFITTPTRTAKFYNTGTGAGLLPYFSAPLRNWGYDVAQLSQPPDLFTRRFTTPPVKTEPAEYFREVPRNDDWVTTLMCSTLANDTKNATETLTTADRAKCPA